jgi:hypothetical protein
MARFRKRIHITLGINLNLSKSGVSATVGKKSASVIIGKNRAYINAGIPGTSIYDRKKLGDGENGKTEDLDDENLVDGEAVIPEMPPPLAIIGVLIGIAGLIALIGFDALAGKIAGGVATVLGVFFFVMGEKLNRQLLGWVIFAWVAGTVALFIAGHWVWGLISLMWLGSVLVIWALHAEQQAEKGEAESKQEMDA